MKRLILLSFCLAMFTISAYAQGQDVIYLKNGSVIKGTIVEQTIGGPVKIATHDGSLYVYQSNEIDRIEKAEPRQPVPVQKSTSAPVNNDTPARSATLKLPKEPEYINKPFTFGIGTGVGYSSYRGKFRMWGAGGKSITSMLSDMIYYEAHVSGAYRFNELIEIQTGLIFSNRGFKVENGPTIKMKQSYLGIPAEVNFYMGPYKRSFFLSTGLAVDFLIHTKISAEGKSLSNSWGKDLFNSAVVSWNFGAGYRGFKINVMLPMSNVLSSKFNDMLSEQTGDSSEMKIKHTTVSLSYTYKF